MSSRTPGISVCGVLLASAVAIPTGFLIARRGRLARWIVGLLALIVAWSIHRTQVWLSKRRVSVFFQQCVGGAMAAAAAVGVALAKGWGVPGLPGIEPGLIVIGAIISMLAGLAILGASEDAISGLYVTGTAHAIHGLIVTIGLVIGASVVVAGASWLGIPVWINAQFSIDGLLGPVSVFWSGIVAAAWAFCTRASRRGSSRSRDPCR